MKLKTKLSLGLVLLFGLLVIVSVLGLFSIHTLSADSSAILKDNYLSLEYVQRMHHSLNRPVFDSISANGFAQYLQQQNQNVTESGEKDATSLLIQEFERLKRNPSDSLARLGVYEQLLVVSDLNLAAIDRKNKLAQQTANQTAAALGVIATICFLIGFVFLFNFPRYIADPVRQLTDGILEIAQGNYKQRIHLKRSDEFGALTDAFNKLAAKLDDYEHSNLARLLFEKKRLETIISALHDPVIGLDENYHVLFANEPALTLLHLSVSKLIGKDAREVALLNDLLRTLLQRMAKPDLEPIKIFADNKESFFLLDTLDILVQTGPTNEIQGIGHVLLLKNVTAFRERDLAKTNFIATISHELKTPISSIKMGLKLLNDERVGALNEEQKHFLNQINEDAGRLLAITSELLKIAQAESGNIQLQIAPTSAAQLVETACQVLAGQIQEKNITLEISGMQPQEDLTVLADEDKAVWVLVNLLSNAIRYSHYGKAVELTTSSQNGYLRFSVKDYGPGIPVEYQNRIFERFFQVPGTGSAGSGLGLAISREFVWAMGGEIGVESIPKQGSLFWFSLPKAKTGSSIP